MKKKILSFLLCLLWPALVLAGETVNPFTGDLQLCPIFEETDGLPSILCPGRVKVSAGSLTDNGDGTVTLSTGAPSIGGTITGGTTGSVLFVGAGPVIQQDNAGLFWNDTLNRFGVGTTDPASAIHIVTNTVGVRDQFSITNTTEGVASGMGIRFIGSAANNLRFFFEHRNDVNFARMGTTANAGLSSSFRIVTNDIDRIYIDGGSVGRIGIGENFTGPSAQLHVRAQVGTEPVLKSQGAASQSANLKEFLNSAGTILSAVDASGDFGIGTAAPNAAAALEISSTTKGFLPSRMTTVQRDAIAAVAGLLIYNTATNKLNFHNGTAWEAVTSA